jgi:NADH-quinone oxidoreductase subunit N
MLPELLLVGAACILILLGIGKADFDRRIAPMIGLIALIVVFGYQMMLLAKADAGSEYDRSNSIAVGEFVQFIKCIAAGVGALLFLLAWPTNKDATGGSAIDFSGDGPEFFALMLLSLAGIFIVAEANDIVLLFLGIELASIPTYIMVSISRPLPVAQEAGVKYFFLGALSAALLLFGFSFLYGVTGSTRIHGHPGNPGIAELITTAGSGQLSGLAMLGLAMVIAGLAFKLAAVPLHVYAADVYQGAATPVTAFLSFVPKTSGMVALVRILFALGGNSWNLPPEIVWLMWGLAALTMTVGNVLGLLQFNIKRVMAYSSIAHSGYMLVAVTALIGAASRVGADAAVKVQYEALGSILFYLTIYGLMNVGLFGVLILLPARRSHPGSSAETFEDIAGLGRKHLVLGMIMSVACFGLIGLPPTVGLWGKLLLLRSAFDAKMRCLAVILVINSAISAAYYLKIIAALFLRPEPAPLESHSVAAPGMSSTTTAPAPVPAATYCQTPVLAAIALSAGAVLFLGVILPAMSGLLTQAGQASRFNVGEQGDSFDPPAQVASK